MSKQFTYVIDEQTLRGKLRSMTAPLNEEAWTKFSAYAAMNIRPVETSRFKGFNLTLNRNTVLPAAFAVIIIFFSFLLFNFISIKNPKKAQLENMNVTPVPFPKTTPALITMPVEKPQNISTGVQNKEAVKVAEATVVKENPPAEKIQEVAVKQEASASVADESMLQASAGKEMNKSRKRRAEEILGINQIDEIRPTVVTEDMNPEIRPN